MEMVFSNGVDKGEQIGPKTGDVCKMGRFEDFYEAYKTQQEFFVKMMVQADNAVDYAHSVRCPLPFQASLIDDCMARGKSNQEGGARYNFTGPQGFGIANNTDGLLAVKTLVFDTKQVTMEEYKEAIQNNFGEGYIPKKAEELTVEAVKQLVEAGANVTDAQISEIYHSFLTASFIPADKKARYQQIREMIIALPKYGNDLEDVDTFAREVGETYTDILPQYTNCRGGIFQAGLYPVSANVPLGYQTGATPDGRLAGFPLGDGSGPAQGREHEGPTASILSSTCWDHHRFIGGIAVNMKFSASLLGEHSTDMLSTLIGTYLERGGFEIQINVTDNRILEDARLHPENYRDLVVRIGGYSDYFCNLSADLQQNVIDRAMFGI